MSAVGSILAKLAVFVVALAVGAFVANVVVGVIGERTPEATVTDAPDYLLASAGDTPDGQVLPVVFSVEPEGDPTPLPTLSPEQLEAVANSLLPAEPAAYKNPSTLPRIPPITQFDGGPFEGANCTLASGAMLARLGYGIVTNGSTLRTLQDDQDGGTGLDDLRTALWRGYGITFSSGLVRPEQLKNLLAEGYGAVIQGDYSRIPRALRLQKDFTGGHAIYLDGYYPGNPKKGIPEAYYVIDPLGRGSGYEGDWWPAVVVDEFGTAFGGGNRIPAMWGYPPGGVPPDVVGPDVLPIPEGGGQGPDTSPEPGESAPPSASPSASPSGPIVFEPGDLPPVTPAFDTPIDGPVEAGGVVLIPELAFCLLEPPPPGCPGGVEAVFEVDGPVLQLPLGPKVEVVFVDSDQPNVAIVGFTVDPAAPATVHYWEADGAPATVMTPTAMSSLDLFGTTVLLAQLDVKAATAYGFQAVAGDGIGAGVSEVGQFTTAHGVEQFDVALSEVVQPAIRLEPGLSPYLHLADDTFAQPLVRLDALESASCAGFAKYGGIGYCLDVVDAPPPVTCIRAGVSWTLSGIDGDGVLVRAFPTEEGVTPEGDVTLEGVLEADGPAPSGEVSVGCLASGLTYHVVLDAVGDDRGILASKDVTVP
jgi:hypothetical protein